MTGDELQGAIGSGSAPLVVDVRSRREYLAGHVPGAVHVPFWAMPVRAGELRRSRAAPIVVYCGHGPRAELAAAALRARGFSRVECLRGHMHAWQRAGRPIEEGEGRDGG